jgi:hypothetical protein
MKSRRADQAVVVLGSVSPEVETVLRRLELVLFREDGQATLWLPAGQSGAVPRGTSAVNSPVVARLLAAEGSTEGPRAERAIVVATSKLRRYPARDDATRRERINDVRRWCGKERRGGQQI